MYIRVEDQRYTVSLGRTPGADASGTGPNAFAFSRPAHSRHLTSAKRGADNQGGRAKQARASSHDVAHSQGSPLGHATMAHSFLGLAGPAPHWPQGWMPGLMPGPMGYPVPYPQGYLPPAYGQQPPWLSGPYPLGLSGQNPPAVALPANPSPGAIQPGAFTSPPPPVSSPGQLPPVAQQVVAPAPPTPMGAPSHLIDPQPNDVEPASGSQGRGRRFGRGGPVADAATTDAPSPGSAAARDGRGGRGRGRGRGRGAAAAANDPPGPVPPGSAAAGHADRVI